MMSIAEIIAFKRKSLPPPLPDGPDDEVMV